MSKTKVNPLTKAPEDYLKEPYARVLIPEAEGGYSAEILEFPGCYSFGDTAEETLQNLEDAALNWIEAALKQGQKIPEPFADNEYSGKALLRLPRSLHQRAAQVAERDGVSLNTFFVSAIAAAVGEGSMADRYLNEMRRLVAQQRIVLASLLKQETTERSVTVTVKEGGVMHLPFSSLGWQ